jgi:hypothetical protein
MSTVFDIRMARRLMALPVNNHARAENIAQIRKMERPHY